MGVTVAANGLSVVHQGSGAKTLLALTTDSLNIRCLSYIKYINILISILYSSYFNTKYLSL